MAIATCVQNSLVCLSLEGPDTGAVYYWDWYWRYPWCKAFFEQRIREVENRVPYHRAIVANPSHARYREVADAFNSATVVRIAGSFNEWLKSCEDRREKAE